MSQPKNNVALENMLTALSKSLSDEELLLSIIQADIATTIASKRISLGLGQKEFANELGVSQSQVSKWESGDTNFTLETLTKISLKLGIEMKSPFTSSRLPLHKIRENIVAFPTPVWVSASSGNIKWTQSNNKPQGYELEEM